LSNPPYSLQNYIQQTQGFGNLPAEIQADLDASNGPWAGSYVYKFRLTGSTSGGVWGDTSAYTYDSSLAAAAVHSNILNAGETGIVYVQLLPGQASYNNGAASEGVDPSGYSLYELSYKFLTPTQFAALSSPTVVDDSALSLSSDAVNYIANTTNVIVTDAATVAQLALIDAEQTTGVLTVTSIADSSSNIVAANGTGLSAYISGAVNVTLLDQPTLAQLKAINGATTGSITLGVTNGALSGTYSDLAAAFNGTITPYTGAFTVTDAGTFAAADLSVLDGKTSGLITAAGLTTLTGTATQVRAVTDSLAASGNNKFSIGAMLGNVSDVAIQISGDTSLANLLAIDLATSGMITAAGVTTLSGTITEIQTVINNLGTGSNKFSIGTMTSGVTDADLSVSDTAVTAANLLALDTKTTGLVHAATGATVTGNDTEWASLVGAQGVLLPADVNATVTGVVSTGISATLPALLSFIGENTSGTIRVEGTTANNTLNFSATTNGLSIDGGLGNDVITGTAYNDVITLGTGTDTLKFASLTGTDTITDYTPSDDLIQLVKSVFTGLTTASGTLSAAEFESAAGQSAATTAAARIIYNSTTGDLYYDADGSGASSAAVHLATLTGAPVLNNNEFFIV